MKIRQEAEARSIAEQAAEWLLVLEEGKPEDHEAFTDWLRKSPLHVGAFLRASAIDSLGAEMDRDKQIPVDLGPFTEAAEVGGAPVSRESMASGRGFGLRAWGLAASVVALAVAALLSFLHLASNSTRIYAAAVGEQRVIELDDGSTMFLEPASSVELRFVKKERWLRVATGGAMFKVAHDPSRPFRVHAGDALVQAVGTQFSVNRIRGEAVISVVEGVVQVSRERSIAERLMPFAPLHAVPVRLSAGQETRVARDGEVSLPKSATSDPVTSWRAKRLTFINETLYAIAGEFNRYNRTPQIRVADAAAGELRFAAAFDANDPVSLVQVLAGHPKLKVERNESEIVIRSR
ncbi:MAG: FecR domain-containing protein [Gammaproteobacteria bacterium]